MPDHAPTRAANDPATADPPTAGGPSTAPGTNPDAEPVPDRVGRYEVVGEIARGGMGVVHRARDPDLNREVAVKLIRGRSRTSPAAVRRFLDEAVITGQLQHPNVPPVHEVGTLPDGSPFLAMKLIRGRTLEALLKDGRDEPGRPPELIGVFEKVAEAVGYAHAHGVVHRDLKPANVMVGAFGEVQVMDWGLAKVLASGGACPRRPAADPDATLGTEIRSTRDAGSETQAGSLLGTPAFMPPEQAIGAIDEIDARSDVFGLGAILCTILTGQPPYDGPDAEAVRKLAARGKLDDAFARLAQSGAAPELVALCKRCLASEKADRPADAGEVARAVAALRAAADERARRAELDRAAAAAEARGQRKLRRVQLALAGVVAVFLAAGVGAAAAVANRLAAEKNDKEAERARAESNHHQARRAVDEFTTRFSEQLRDVPGIQPFRRELLESALKYYQGFAAERAGDPGVRAELAAAYWRAGGILLELGRNDEAEAACGQALALQEELLRDRPDDTDLQESLAATLNDLGVVRGRQGRPAEGLPPLERSIALREDLARRRPDDLLVRQNLAGGYNNLGVQLDELGRADESLRAHRQALRLREELLGRRPDDPVLLGELAKSHNNLGAWHHTARRPGEALRHYEQARDLWEKLRARTPPAGSPAELAKTHYNLGLVHQRAGRGDEAVRTHTRSVELLRDLVRESPAVAEFRRGLAQSYNSLGLALAGRGKAADALAAFRQSHAQWERLVKDHPGEAALRPDFARCCSNLGAMLQKLNRPAEAVPALEQARDLYDALARARPDDRSVRVGLALAHLNLGGTLADAGRPADALPACQKAIDGFAALLAADPGDPSHRERLSSAWENRGNAQSLLKRWDEAAAAYAEAVAVLRPIAAASPESRAQLADQLGRLAEAHRAAGRHGPAAEAALGRKAAAAGNPVGLYNAACDLALCVPLAGAAGADADRRRYADLAVATLRAAAAAGYRDAKHLAEDADLRPLRNREDFRALVASLRRPVAPPPRPAK